MNFFSHPSIHLSKYMPYSRQREYFISFLNENVVSFSAQYTPEIIKYQNIKNAFAFLQTHTLSHTVTVSFVCGTQPQMQPSSGTVTVQKVTFTPVEVLSAEGLEPPHMGAREHPTHPHLLRIINPHYHVVSTGVC